METDKTYRLFEINDGRGFQQNKGGNGEKIRKEMISMKTEIIENIQNKIISTVKEEVLKVTEDIRNELKKLKDKNSYQEKIATKKKEKIEYLMEKH